MSRKCLVAALATFCLVASSTLAHAQRGMGDSSGMARRAVKPELTTLSGKIVSVVTAPCEKTTGRSEAGTHMFLEDSEGEQWNVHLGEAAALRKIVPKLQEGLQVKVTAFRTDKMPEGHYVAKSLSLENEVIELRDDNLRPFWAGRGHGAARRGGGRRWRGGRGAGRRGGRGGGW